MSQLSGKQIQDASIIINGTNGQAGNKIKLTGDWIIDESIITSKGIADFTNPSEFITKEYASALINGLSLKKPVVLASTSGIDISSPPAVHDGVTLEIDDRWLLKDQDIPAENGIYRYTSSSSALVRTDDFDENSSINEVISGSYVYVKEGSANSGASFILTTPDPITVDTTDLTWEWFPNFLGDVYLSSLKDVSIVTPQNNEVLLYNGSNWINSSAIALQSDLDSHITDFNNATTGINDVLNNLNFEYNDYTTAGLLSAVGNDGEIFFNDNDSNGSDTHLLWDNTNKRIEIGNPTSSTGKLTVKGDSGNALISEFLDDIENPVLEIKKDGSIKIYETTDTITEDGSIWLDGNTDYLKLIKDTVEYVLNIDKLKDLLDVLLTASANGDVLIRDEDNDRFINTGTEELTNEIFRKSLNISSDQILNFDIPAAYSIEHIVMENTAISSVNVSIGSTMGNTDIVSAQNVNGSSFVVIKDSDLVNSYFDLYNETELYASSTSWGTSIVNIYFKFKKLLQ